MDENVDMNMQVEDEGEVATEVSVAVEDNRPTIRQAELQYEDGHATTVVIFEDHGEASASQSGDGLSQSIIGASDSKSKFWTHEATLLLIELYKSYQDSMRDPRVKKKDVWNRIAADMAANGFQFHGDMCDKKWRNLKKSYFSVLESKSVQGGSNTRRLWQYFDTLNEVFPKEASNSTDQASGSTVVIGDNAANGTLVKLSGRTPASASKTMRTRSKMATSAAANSQMSELNAGVAVSVVQHSELDLALEDMPPMQALKILLERQERIEEKRMNRMMEELRKMHDENLEVMHERNVLLHRLIEQLSSGT